MRKNSLTHACVITCAVLSFVLADAAAMDAQSATAPSSSLRWDVISVKPMTVESCATAGGGIRRLPDGISVVCAPMAFVIEDAYHIMDASRIAGLPEWTEDKSKPFSIEARVSGEDAAAFAKLSNDQKVGMLQLALVERFHLKSHTETRQLAAYDLVVAKGGPKLKEAEPDEASKGTWQFGALNGEVKWVSSPAGPMIWFLGKETGRPVVDRTGLTGKYDFTLEFTPAARAATDTTGRPSVFTALEEQLGLKLVPAKEPVDVLVIDSIEQPTAN